ncbi:MAG: FAD-dependent oxidoreductase [Chloroflexi bacterium]|nr:FAD-dependent oxidoreductase [Chloroflexota bacterium]
MTTRGGSPDVIVVGGGAIGTAAAYRMVKHGAKVLLLERDGVAEHASGFAYGGLYATTGAGIPGPLLPVAKACVEHHRRLAPELKELTGIDVQFRPAASIDLAFDRKRLEDIVFDATWQLDEGFEVRILSENEVRALEPLVSERVIGGALHTSHYEVDSYKFTFGMGWAVEKSDGEVRKANVRAVRAERGRAEGVVLEDGTALHTETIVLATGPWAGTPQIKGVPPLPVRPVKGEILRLEFPGDGFRHRVTFGGHYIARKPDGLVWAGTTEDDNAGFDDEPSDAARQSILSGVLKLSPALEGARLVRQTACLRPVSVDGLPMIGPVPGVEGLFIANGAGKKGILLSPAIAEMVAALVLDRRADAVPPPFRVSRFHSSATMSL